MTRTKNNKPGLRAQERRLAATGNTKFTKRGNQPHPPSRQPQPAPPRQDYDRHQSPRREYGRAPSPRRNNDYDRGYEQREPELYSRKDDVFQFGGRGTGDQYRPEPRGQDHGDSYGRRQDSYQPVNSYADRRRSRSPPRGSQNDTYPSRQDLRDQRSDFNFKFSAPGTISEGIRTMNSLPDRPRPLEPRGRQHFEGRAGRGGRGGRGNRSGRGGYGGYGAPKRAADRPFLQGNREPTPELMHGMDEDANNATKYRDINELSDSDEEEMDMSDDDRDASEEERDQPRKKQARTVDRKAADGDSVPRWSNPDPYTALPPPDESQRKKKNVVKLIRKARVDQINDASKTTAESDDFISFDFDDDKESVLEPQSEPDSSLSNIPTGPRFSHKDVLHQSLPSTLPPKPPHHAAKSSIPLESSVNESLGNRKRTFDDQIRGPPPVIKQHSLKAKPDGRVLSHWSPKSDPTPWCIFDHSATENMGSWLHREIVDFYDHVKPQKFEDTIRSDLLYDLEDAVSGRWGDARIREFGSFPAGLYLPTADMDVVMVSDKYMDGSYGKYDTHSHLRAMRSFLERGGLAAMDSVECIFGAKVPLVKYIDRVTGLRVDVSFENDTGLVANKTFQDWKNKFPAMPILVTLIKQFMTMRGLNEPVNGGIGGFSVICLVVSLLQHMPQVVSGNMIPEHHLGEILMEFFDLYGNHFDFQVNGIRMVPPGYVSKNEVRRQVYKLADKKKFCIIDPNNPSNDIAGGSSNTPTIIKAFKDAYNALKGRMEQLEMLDLEERRNQSILGVILGGDYSSFDQQREHLRYLYSTRRNGS